MTYLGRNCIGYELTIIEFRSHVSEVSRTVSIFWGIGNGVCIYTLKAADEFAPVYYFIIYHSLSLLHYNQVKTYLSHQDFLASGSVIL